jgi:hypothetical protein
MSVLSSSDKYLNFVGDVKILGDKLSTTRTETEKRYAIAQTTEAITTTRPKVISYADGIYNQYVLPLCKISTDPTKNIIGVATESKNQNQEILLVTKGIVDDPDLTATIVGEIVYSDNNGNLSVASGENFLKIGRVIQLNPCKIFINIPKDFDELNLPEKPSADRSKNETVKIIRNITFDIPFVDIKLSDGINYMTLLCVGDKIYAGGNKKSISSDGGLTWTPMATPPSGMISKIIYANEIFVACVNNISGKIATSFDGSNWQEIDVESGIWEGIAYGNGIFIACKSLGETIIYSTDGFAWSTREASSVPYGGWNVCFGDGIFVITGSSTGKTIYSNDNGLTWQESDLDDSESWFDIAYGNGVFVTLRDEGGNSIRFATSPDGATWTEHPLVTTSALNLPPYTSKIAFGEGHFVVGAKTLTNRVIKSSNGIDWSPIEQTFPNTHAYNTTNYSNGLFLLQGIGVLTRQILL